MHHFPTLVCNEFIATHVLLQNMEGISTMFLMAILFDLKLLVSVSTFAIIEMSPPFFNTAYIFFSFYTNSTNFLFTSKSNFHLFHFTFMDIFVRTILWPKARLWQEKKQWLLSGDLATSFMYICYLSSVKSLYIFRSIFWIHSQQWQKYRATDNENGF